MQKQFDSTIVGRPYSRVMRITIDNYAPLTASVEVILQPHVKLWDDTHQPLGSSEILRFNILPSNLAADSFELRDPATGATIGQSMRLSDLYAGIASLIREKELAALNPASTPPQQGEVTE